MNFDRIKKSPDSNIDCPRCDTRMKSAGEAQLHEGSLAGGLVTQGLATMNYFTVQVEICPKCGKVEFYV